MGADVVLGSRMHSFGVVLRGHYVVDARWCDFLKEVARSIGMSPVGEPKVWDYPLQGKGGTGQTIVLPITESFLVVDTWWDHDGAYLFVCSCREFAIGRVLDTAEAFGLKPSLHPQQGAFFHTLRLK